MPRDMKKLREMNVESLTAEATAIRDEIWKLRLQRATGQLEGPRRIVAARRDLARVLTLRRAAELASQSGGFR